MGDWAPHVSTRQLMEENQGMNGQGALGGLAIPHLQPGHKGPVTKSWQYNMSILFKKTKPRPFDPFPQRARLQPSRGQSGGTLQDARLAGSAPLQALLPPLCSWQKEAACLLHPPGSTGHRALWFGERQGPWTCRASGLPGRGHPAPGPDPGPQLWALARQTAVCLGMELVRREHARRP